MKNLSAVFFTMVACSAHAMDVTYSVDSQSGDVTALIANPVHDASGFPFSPNNESEGKSVCKYLGYERSATKSMKFGRSKTDIIHLDPLGNVTSASVDFPMTQIICVNKTQRQQTEKSVVLKNPIHLDAKLPFSPDNETEGNSVCKYLGYERSATKSMKFGRSKTDIIHLDSNGNVTSAPVDFPMTQIVCIEKI